MVACCPATAVEGERNSPPLPLAISFALKQILASIGYTKLYLIFNSFNSFNPVIRIKVTWAILWTPCLQNRQNKWRALSDEVRTFSALKQ